MEEISYSGQLTQDELAATLRMGSLWKKWHIIVYWILLGCVGVGFLTGLILNLESVYLPVPLMVLLFIGGSFYFTPAMNAKKLFTQDTDFKFPLSGVISEAGLSIQARRTQTQIQWTLYKSARLSPGNVLLYQTNNCFNVFPRKFFASDADWKAFRSLVEQKVEKKTYISKDPTPPRFGRHANWIIYGVLFLVIVLMLVYNFTFYAPNP